MTADFPSDAERDDETRALASDEAFARLEKEMASMKNATGGLSDQIADAASDVGSAAQEGLRHARPDVGSLAADASDRLGVAAGAAQSQASSLADALEDTVRERPLSAVALALGLGFVIGAAWRR
jgi:ElaB/YqjD/DUF883 family membrane-anchored ribosome-binding protein